MDDDGWMFNGGMTIRGRVKWWQWTIGEKVTRDDVQAGSDEAMDE